MEERIADERNFSAVLGPSTKAIRRLVRKHFAMLGKRLLTAEVNARDVDRTVCVRVTRSMERPVFGGQAVANTLVRLSLAAVRAGPSNSITSNRPGLTARPVVATLAA